MIYCQSPGAGVPAFDVKVICSESVPSATRAPETVIALLPENLIIFPGSMYNVSPPSTVKSPPIT